jgi:nucleotide-binding universal stress UspA family protein
VLAARKEEAMIAVGSHASRPAARSSPQRREGSATSTALREILFASDLSPASDRAFEHARLLAERFRARLSLYHAIEVDDDTRDLNGAAGQAGEVWRRVELAARAHLDRQLLGGSLASEIRLERSTAVGRSLVALILAARPDLTVMATHGRGGLAHLVLGSVTETVLRRSQAPVLCVPQPAHGPALPYRRVLVPTDLSAASRRAFPLAAQLARGFGAEVLAVHAVELHTLSGATDALRVLTACEEALLAFLQPAFSGLRILPRVQLGPPWDRITQTALDDRADVIVMTAASPKGTAERVLGSQVERVVRTAPCPVLVT